MTGPATNVRAVVWRSIMRTDPTLVIPVTVTHWLLRARSVTRHFRRIAGRVIVKNRMVSTTPWLDASRTETRPSERRGFSRTNGSLRIAMASRMRASTGPAQPDLFHGPLAAVEGGTALGRYAEVRAVGGEPIERLGVGEGEPGVWPH